VIPGSSREVQSSQAGIHPGLARRVRRQAASDWRKPPQAVDQPALERLDQALNAHMGPVLLDSFCGTGLSSTDLARAHPEALIVGVDQSAHRLSRAENVPANCLLLQAHCEAVWRALVDRRVQLQAHTILYPNPWPKAAHLGRRVHGHPAFGLLLRLGGHLELRSNWRLYVEEFGVALNLRGHTASVATVPDAAVPTTRFERKYRASGHTLWQLHAQLGIRPAAPAACVT